MAEEKAKKVVVKKAKQEKARAKGQMEAERTPRGETFHTIGEFRFIRTRKVIRQRWPLPLWRFIKT